ncbi:MAG: phytanoyl-CoA dioxygenase family protein [Novosphingobium sp.]|nr:phytanoyl-CoA dioxygenase family protein [Novosphingobium sp.]
MPNSAFDPDRQHDLADNFRRDGYLVLPDMLESERAASLLQHLYDLYPGYVGGDLPYDIKSVGDRRFNAPIRFEPPFECPDFLTNPLLDALLSEILGDDYVVEAFGVISALPGAELQRVHRDGGPLFPEAGFDGILPPSAITVILPLGDMDEHTGCTRFWAGSQRNEFIDETRPSVTPEIGAGSFALWDFRTYHRGLANTSDHARPLLYFTACRPFWMDHRNFEKGRNARLLASRASIGRLEEKAAARFVRAEFID